MNPGTGTGDPPSAPVRAGFSSKHSPAFQKILRGLTSSLAVSTYQSGRLILVRDLDGKLNTHFRTFKVPMGIATKGKRLVFGTKHQVWEYRNVPAVSRRLDPPDRHDACFLPLSCHYTGDVSIHELGLVKDEVVFVNTQFSCLATVSATHSFKPVWRPRFVSALAAQDRCHLNGMAVIDDEVRYVSALGTSDEPGGWRQNKATGGVVVDTRTDDLVLEGLCMPHSPRWHRDRLWVLESGKGSLSVADLKTGTVESVIELPGFTRGLAFAGRYAFVGLSQVRDTVFEGLPITNRATRECGVWVVDINTGRDVAFLRFDGIVREIFDVQLLRGMRFPELEDPEGDIAKKAYVLADDDLAHVPANLRT